jgi:hypothetical protein
MPRKLKVLLASAVACAFLALLLVPLPLALTDSDREYAVKHALSALLHKKRVWLSSQSFAEKYNGLHRLFECDNMDKRSLYYENGTNVPDLAFEEYGFKRASEEANERGARGRERGVVVMFSHVDITGKKTEHMQFYYMFGNMDIWYYDIKIRKSLLMTYISYECTGVT